LVLLELGTTSPNPIGTVAFRGGEDGTSAQVAAVIAVADEAWTAASSATRLAFRTTSSGNTSDTERMTIGSTGDVDILASLTIGNTLSLNSITNQILLDADGTFTGQITMATLSASRRI